MKADLHMHSTHSDGLYTTEELFKMARDKKVDMIAITDHDTCLDVDYNKHLAKEYGVRYLPGIELTTVVDNKNVHLLGYFTDKSYENEEMINYYKNIKLKREKRAKQFIINLKKHFDLDVDYEDCYQFGRGIIARPHIAKAIIKRYPQYTHNYIFDNFIGDHSKAYVPSSLLSLQEGIDLLKRNNCVVVLAHPVLLKPHIKDDVLSHEYDGIEAIYYQNTKEDTNEYINYALKHGMLYTAGSDFHGIPNDSKHGEIGDCVLTKEPLKQFLKAIKKRG